KRAYCLKTQPATGETYPKSDLFNKAQLTLTSTPNAQTFYEKHGFMFIRESKYPSRLAQTDVRGMDMSIAL
ncbi:hypothetical protein BVZ25_12295, partial [Klebsiella quasipneumoniae]